MNLPGEAGAHLAARAALLDGTYREVAARVPDNAQIAFDDDGRLHFAALEPEPEPASLLELRAAVNAMLPRVDLPEVVLEVFSWTGADQAFTSVTGGETRLRDLHVTIAALLVAVTEHGRTCLRAFLNWAMQSRHCRRSLSIPGMKISQRAALSEDECLDALGRLLTDAEIPVRLRVAGVIVLLYAQPVSRIVRLSVTDVVRDGDNTVLLRLGDPASPVPAPVAALLLAHIANRDNMNTATNPASRWLFPGRRAGQPSRPDHLSALLNDVGVPAAAARGAAIRRQLLELPAPVVADALGYHDKTTTRLLNEIGGTWSRYAPGDHGKSLPGSATPTTLDS